MSYISHSYRLGVVLFVLGAVLSLPPAVAQEAAQVVRNTVSLSQDGTVTVDNHEGSITVTSWDQSRVQYEARIMPTDEDPTAEKTQIEVDRSEAQLALSTEHAEGDDESTIFGFSFDSGWQWGSTDIPPVHYTLKIPSRARLSIDDHESTIEITDLEAPLEIDTHEGPISVTDHRGDILIDSHESDKEFQSTTGRLEIDTHDGPVRVRDHEGPLTISTHDGQVDLQSIQGRVSIDAHESQLTIEDLRGGFALDAHDGRASVNVTELSENVRIDTYETDVTLGLPGGTGFTLNTDFDDDASLDSNLDLLSVRDTEGDEVNYRGPVNGGGPEIYLESDDGRFVLRSQ